MLCDPLVPKCMTLSDFERPVMAISRHKHVMHIYTLKVQSSLLSTN